MEFKEKNEVSFQNKIGLMMFGFGDSHTPNENTVRLVESIVFKQLRSILSETQKKGYAKKDFFNGEGLVFLMRKDKWKMRRFVKYLHNKEFKIKIEGELMGEDKKTFRSNLLNFITKIDETGELTDLAEFDETKHERQMRANRISLALDEKKYLDFQKARRTSFSSKNFDELRRWIDPKEEFKFSNSALDVLSYYAYETVAQIVDYALLVRMDSRRTNDPLGHLSGSHYTAMMFNGEHRFAGENPDFSRVYSGRPAITVHEIREVIRRVNQPQAGKLNFGRQLPATSYLFAV